MRDSTMRRKSVFKQEGIRPVPSTRVFSPIRRTWIALGAAFVVAATAFVLVWNAPFFGWGYHADTSNKLTMLEGVVQFHHPAPPSRRRDTMDALPPPMPVSISASAYFQDGQRMGLGHLRDVAASVNTPAPNQVLSFNGERWAATAVADTLPGAYQRGAPNGIPTLDATGRVPESQIPQSTLISVHVVANITERDALTQLHSGEIAIVADSDGAGSRATYIWDGTAWQLSDSANVDSVNGATGNVVLTTDNVAQGSVNRYFSDALAAAAPAVAANTAHAASSANPHSVTKAQVGLPNVPDVKHNLGATSDPVATSDSVAGYVPGSTWINLATGGVWTCVDNTASSALWRRTDLYPNAVTTAELAPGAVTGSHIASAAVSATHLDASYQRGVPNGVSTLDANGLIPAAQLPPLSITSVTVCANITCRDAVTAQTGDVVVVNDAGAGHPETYIWDGAAWISIQESSNVISVAGKTGVVALDTGDVGEGANLYYTEARVSANADVASNTAHRSNVANPHAVTKTQLGLGNVQNTKMKLDGGAPPAVTDDETAGYGVSSLWVDTVADRVYICVAPTASAAVWVDITQQDTDTGETNTASNVGAGGVGLFKQKSGVNLEFKKINAGSARITVADDTGNSELDIDVAESAIVHDNLSGFVAARHVDHSAVSISPGVGLSGGGTLEATRTLDLDINSLSTDGSPAAGDYVATYDVSAAGVKKALVSALPITKAQVGLADVPNVKQNLGATTDPGATDDSAAGYTVGSLWINTATDAVWTCADASVAAAVWRRVDLYANAVTATELAANAVTSGHIADGTIAAADLDASYQRGVANGIPTLDTGGLIPVAQLPPLSITSVTVCADIACRDALTVQTGDVVKVNDAGAGHPETYIWDGSVWVSIQESSDVISVAGKTGVVTLDTGDVGEGANLYYTEARVSANTNVAANTAHGASTANPHSVTKTQVGLGNVQNTKVKLDATAAPGVTDDTTAGYAVGSLWVDTTGNKAHVCVDATASAAVWVEITQQDTDTGESNTASNVGTSGVGLFKQKSGVDLEFKKINAGSARITITDDTGNSELDIDVAEGAIVHDNLSGFVEAEHVDHSAVSISPGIGLSGGGTLEATRTLDLDINSLTTDGTPAAGDYVATYDVSATGHKKVLLSALPITKAQVGLADVPNIKQNFAAVTDPGATDDSSAGYAVGSAWINTATDAVWRCADATAAAAVWRRVDLYANSISGTELASNAVTSAHIVDGTIVAADLDASYQRGVANGIPTLDAGGLIPTAQLPPLSITSVTVCADIACRDALTVQTGDVVKVNDAGSGYPETYIWDGSAWVSIQESSDVISVAGKTGVVTLDTGDVGEGANLYYTEARVSANTNVAANTAHGASTANPHSVTKTQVGLGNVQNTKVKLDATAAPGATDDTTAGYAVGSLWVDVTGDKAYVCVDSTTSAAVWVDITQQDTDTGEVNTASNIGTGGVGVFKQKSGVDLEFKKINAGSARITVTDDTGNNELDIDVAEGSIVHDNLSGFVAAEHVDHSAVSVSAGIGLSGGGTLEATRTLDLDINSLTADGAPAAGDYVATYDVSATGHKKVLLSDLPITKTQVGLGNVQDTKVKLDATAAPGATDDAGAGYSVGSLWVDVTGDKAYVCVDSTTSAAVWVEITAGAGGGEANTASNVGTGGVGVFKQKSGVDLEFKKINAGSARVTVTDDVANNEIDIDVPAKDVQEATASAETTTTSGTFVDIDSMTITVSNGGSGNYLVFFNAEFEDTNIASNCDFIINVNGADVASSARTIRPGTDEPALVALQTYATGVSNGQIIKMRWKVAAGTLKARERSLIVQQV